MSEYTHFANPIGTRLKAEMKKRGFTSSELARRANVLTSFLYDIISGKSSNPSTVKLARVAEALGISLTYLVSGGDELGASPDLENNKKHIMVPYVALQETASGNNLIHAKVSEPFCFSREWIQNCLKTAPENLRLFTMSGDSMEPTMAHHDTVIIDISKCTPSPPGIFVIYDGFGLTSKRLEYFTESKDSRVRVISDNPQYSTYECSISELTIIGRVVWFSRKI